MGSQSFDGSTRWSVYLISSAGVLASLIGGPRMVAAAEDAQILTGRSPAVGAGAASLPNREPTNSRIPLPHPLAGVGAIIEADVVSASYSFSEGAGPRTDVRLENIVVHAGSAPEGDTISQFGGPLPDGYYIWTAELPVLHPGSRYIFFLGKEPWFYTPIWSLLAYRVEAVGVRKLVLGIEGHPVLGFDTGGARFGATRVVDISGQPDPLLPVKRSERADVSAPDVAHGLTPAEFIQAAKNAAGQVGTQFGKPCKLKPTPRPRWDVLPTSQVSPSGAK